MTPGELPAKLDPETDPRLTSWETVHHLIGVFEAGGESAAAEMVDRLYTVCERKKRAAEAFSYNALVQSWPEITRLARESGKPPAGQPPMFGDEA